MSLVLDASAAVDLVLGRPEVAALLAGEDIHVPASFDIDTSGALRSLELRRYLPAADAERARGDLAQPSVVRYPAPTLVQRAWAFRHMITIHDGVYVALAEGLRCRLLTTDLRLGRAARAHVEVLTPGRRIDGDAADPDV